MELDVILVGTYVIFIYFEYAIEAVVSREQPVLRRSKSNMYGLRVILSEMVRVFSDL